MVTCWGCLSEQDEEVSGPIMFAAQQEKQMLLKRHEQWVGSQET